MAPAAQRGRGGRASTNVARRNPLASLKMAVMTILKPFLPLGTVSLHGQT
jgi:hypothetical protein